jgi:HlyD family secretion protein
MTGRFRLARVAMAAVAVLAAIAVGWQVLFSNEASDSADVVELIRGTFTDVVEIRGQIEPVRSTYVTAPFNAGELQVVNIVRSGDVVEAGDVVVEFDAVTLRRTMQEKQGELRSARAELEQHDAQSRIGLEERRAAVAKAEFDVERAYLALGEIGLVSEIEAERNRLALADARQRLEEARAALASAGANAASERRVRESAVEKVLAELELAERQAASLKVRAPIAGIVNILSNYRATNPVNPTPQEFRAGDRVWPGAPILDLPDLSSAYVTARLDEADRGRLTEGQPVHIRLDAVADRDYRGRVVDISLLARVDFTSGWPPPKQFDLAILVEDADDRLRPGMSANARVEVGRIDDVLIVPAASVFYEDGRTVVYRRGRRGFDAVPVDVVRRGRDDAVVEGALQPGDLIARLQPGAGPAPEVD